MSVLFSIIMPVYNNEDYFPKAVQSILEQDYTEFELIIVDDGSTDRTPQIADEIAEQDDRVKVIHQKNQWIYASFNNGIQMASGDYIYIVNSDDKLRPGALGLMEKKIKKYAPDVIWTKVLSHICDVEQNILVYDRGKAEEKVEEDAYYPDKETVRNSWIYFVKSGLSGNQANLYRREIALCHPFRNDVYAADVLFNISIANDICSAVVMKESLYDHYVYNRSDMNASMGKYYGYEHNMFNDIYIGYKKLFQEWKIPLCEYQTFLNKQRVSQMTTEINALSRKECTLSIEDKIKTIYQKYVDDIVYQCALELDELEELESRILSGTRALLTWGNLSEDSEMYFIYELLESLLCYEKDEDDYRRIKQAVCHPLNPFHIGEIFYKKLIKEW